MGKNNPRQRIRACRKGGTKNRVLVNWAKGHVSRLIITTITPRSHLSQAAASFTNLLSYSPVGIASSSSLSDLHIFA